MIVSNNKKLSFMNNFFKFKYQFFIFIFLLLFFNPSDVFAIGSDFTQVKHGTTDVIILQEITSETSKGGKVIFSSSYDIGYIHYGETEQLLKYRLSYESSHGKNYNKKEFLDWVLDSTELVLEEDILAYGDCIIFNDSYDGDPYYCTGWLYLYSDTNRYMEYAENLAGIGNEYIPLFYEEGATEGSLFLTVPSAYFYYPVSNMIRDDELGVFQTQIYTSGNDYKNNDAITIHSAENIVSYYKHATQGKGKIHDVDDFAGIYGLNDLKVYDYTLPKDYAWVMAFCCSALVKNADASLPEGSTGFSYTEKYSYPIYKHYIYEAVSRLTTEGSPDYVPSLPAFMDTENILSATRVDGQFYGMKEVAQTLGVDIIFSGVVNNGAAARVGIQKDRIPGPDSWGELLDVSATLENLYNKLCSLGTKDEPYKVTAENIYQLYDECKVIFKTNYGDRTIMVSNGQSIPAGFIKVNGFNVALRYLWSASSGYLMADTEINFARDTHNVYNISEQLKSDTWRNSKSTLNGSKYLSSLSDFGTERYYGTNEIEQIKSVLILLQYYPEMLDSIASSVPTVSRYLDGKRGIAALAKLNSLGVENYAKWKECVLAIGEVIYSHTLASNNPSNGWSSHFGLLRNGGSNYSIFDTGISLCQTVIVRPQLSDFVMSNSYNKQESTYGYSSDDIEAKYNPTARNVIDWMHGAAKIENRNYFGGSSSLPSIQSSKFTTVLDASSSWQNYDISSFASQGNTIDGLKKDTNNVIDIKPDSSLAKGFNDNTESFVFDTMVFVGRTPEANPEDKVSVGEIQVLAKSNYNQFELANDDSYAPFSASEDVDAAARYNIAMFSKDGTAKTALSGYFASFYTDYNTQVLFNIYSGQTTNYYAQDIIKVKVNPVKIQKAINVEGYKYEDYPELGYKSSGYGNITGGAWTNVSGNTDFAPGDVVAYQLDYRIPNSKTLDKIAELNQNNITILETGAWYQEYGQVLTADVDYWIVPQYTDEAIAKFGEVNKNTNNDWVKMRIISPVMDNMYFINVEVHGASSVSGAPYTANTETHPSGILMAKSGQGNGHVRTVEVKDLGVGNSTIEYNTDKVWITTKWQYWAKGRTQAEINALKNDYNYINYYNGFKLSSGKIVADTVANGNPATMSIVNQKAALTIEPNKDFLNAAKDKSIRLQVPNNDCNDFHQDWEIIVVDFEGIPEKDNSVMDLVLVQGGETFGNVTRANGRQHEAQQIPHELTGARLYAVIERLAPAMTWREVPKNKNVGNVHCHFQLTVDDNKSSGLKRGNSFTGSVPGNYNGVPLSAFDMKGEQLIYYIDLSGPFSYLSATANYRNMDDGCYDNEDINMTNNYWSEIWESTTNPNFVLDIVDGQPNVQQSTTICKGEACPLKPIENLRPYLEFDIAQDNPNAQGSWVAWVHVTMDGKIPEKWSGNVSYFGSASKVTSIFSTGDVTPRRITVTWPEMTIQVSKNSTKNITYTMTPHINYGCCYTVTDETYLQDNHKEWRWTANVTCIEDSTCKPTPAPCCIFPYRRTKEAKVFWGAGRTYYWDVVFEWSQQFTQRTEAVNVMPRPHLVNCTCPSYTKDDGTYVEKKHTHCWCFCNPGVYYGPNHGQKWWRNSGPSYPGLGKGQYYETWNMKIIVRHSAHGGGGYVEESIGTIYLYAGEDFNVRYEAIYNSNRESQPESPYTPRSQPYVTGNGGRGCSPCNRLSRLPDYKDVEGPRYADIKCSGTQDYNYDYRFIAGTGGGTACNKLYRWTPIPDTIAIEENQIVCQTMTLYFCIYDFKGHVGDTSTTLGGRTPGYAWYTRETQAYCDSKTGIAPFCPSKVYIGSSMAAEGLDTSSGGENDHAGFIDGDVWVQ